MDSSCKVGQRARKDRTSQKFQSAVFVSSNGKPGSKLQDKFLTKTMVDRSYSSRPKSSKRDTASKESKKILDSSLISKTFCVKPDHKDGVIV